MSLFSKSALVVKWSDVFVLSCAQRWRVRWAGFIGAWLLLGFGTASAQAQGYPGSGGSARGQ